MFSEEHNWVEHLVTNGICLRCKQHIPGLGLVYTKEGKILLIKPAKSKGCHA